MTVKTILTEPNKLLRQVSEPVKSVGFLEQELMDDMLETMYKAPGIGLAAIQIGVLNRVVVIDLVKDNEKKNPLYLVNPEITFKSNHTSTSSILPWGCVKPGHIMSAPLSTNLMAPLSTLNFGIIAGHLCKILSVGNHGPFCELFFNAGHLYKILGVGNHGPFCELFLCMFLRFQPPSSVLFLPTCAKPNTNTENAHLLSLNSTNPESTQRVFHCRTSPRRPF